MAGLEDFIPIALIKIEGQLGHQNAIEAAKLELQVLSLQERGNIPDEKLKKFFAEFIQSRKDVDEYVSKSIDSLLEAANRLEGEQQPAPADDVGEEIIAKMNAEKEAHNGHNH